MKKITITMLLITLLNFSTVKIFAKSNVTVKSKEILKEPVGHFYSTNKYIPRLGDEIIFSIDNFGYENTEYGIFSDYYTGILNFEESNKFKPDDDKYKYNIDAAELQKIDFPSIKVEKYTDGRWIDEGSTGVFFIRTRYGAKNVKEKIGNKDEDISFTVTRNEILNKLEKEDIIYGNILEYWFRVRDKAGGGYGNGNPKDYYNRLTANNPIKMYYKIVDKPSVYPYISFKGNSSYFMKNLKTDISTERVDKKYEGYRLYFETSEIKLELEEENKKIKLGDSIDINLIITNKSKNIPNRYLYTGYDFGSIEKTPKKEIDGYFQNPYNEKNFLSDIIGTNETKRFKSILKIPNIVTNDMLNEEGKLIVNPFLYTPTLTYDEAGKGIWTYHTEEREYDDPILIDIEKQEYLVNFETNCGNNIENQTVKNKEKAKEPKAPTKDGYEFVGWYENEDLTGSKFDFNTEITEDITLYAKWKKIEKPTEPTKPTDPTETVDIDTVILANGTKYTDVLTATVLGNEEKAPILLSTVNEVDSKTKAEIERLNPKEIIISGGENSVSEKTKIELEKEGYKVKRISGIDRYKTAEEIAKEVRALTGVKDEVMLVDGTNFPDVITISPYASNKHTPILLTEPNSLNDTTKKALKEFEIEEITIGGEKNSVSKEIEKFLKADYKVSRIGGKDRYETASLIAKEIRKQTGNKDNLILVDGTDFPDGITISSLANKYQSPIHLTNPKELTKITNKDIKGFKIKNITIGGGKNSVSKSIENELKAQEIITNRIAGIDRYATAVEISKEFTK